MEVHVANQIVRLIPPQLAPWGPAAPSPSIATSSSQNFVPVGKRVPFLDLKQTPTG